MQDWNKIPVFEKCVTPQGTATLTCLPAVFQNILFSLVLFAGIVSMFMLMYAGIKYIRSTGDPKQIEEAHHAATYAILGLFVVLLSFLIINLIAYITGATCITFFGFGNCQ